MKPTKSRIGRTTEVYEKVASQFDPIKLNLHKIRMNVTEGVTDRMWNFLMYLRNDVQKEKIRDRR